MQNASIVKNKILKRILLIFLGALVGVANGLFGSGGGMIAVPTLRYIAGYDQKQSQATAIAVILPVSILSAVVYILSGNYDLTLGLFVGGGAVVGAIVGALVMKNLSNKFLTILFCLLMIAGGIKLVWI